MTNREELVALADRLDSHLRLMQSARNKSHSLAVWADDLLLVKNASDALRALSSRDDGEAKSITNADYATNDPMGVEKDCPSEAPSTIPADVEPAIENLKNCQTQLDQDGVMVGVSRQALEEVLNAISRIPVPAKADDGEIDVPGKTAGGIPMSPVLVPDPNSASGQRVEWKPAPAAEQGENNLREGAFYLTRGNKNNLRQLVGPLAASGDEQFPWEAKVYGSVHRWSHDGTSAESIVRDIVGPPVYAWPAAEQDVAVKVKPLEWRDHRPDSFPEPAWSAQTPFGFYNIEEVCASDSPAYVVRLHAHHFIADKDDLADAKSAAQADYETRIRSALETEAQSVAVSVDDLVNFIKDKAYTTFDDWEDDFARSLLDKYSIRSVRMTEGGK